ncbi:GFA family protein [Acidovorax sp.]|uniref:GFA family protein n=1 Tax=Acidovorax sp. TaxID=1872122 RepID=UPI002ACDF26D|nr:GFA family protein [Acidovorax sp.]MDZ7863754.1 GFA family protein [Acidovorax sp.]
MGPDNTTPSHPQPSYRGSCLCGAIHYEARAEIKGASHCHCGMCRKAHGAAFGSYGNVPVGSFSFTRGADLVKHRASSPGVTRSFCPECGSPLTWHSEHGDAAAWMSFSLGTLDTPFVPAKALRSIHADSVPAWHGGEWPHGPGAAGSA